MTTETDTQRMRALSLDQLRKQADSLIENMTAFRLSLARIAELEDCLRECMKVLRPSAGALAVRIGHILGEDRH